MTNYIQIEGRCDNRGLLHEHGANVRIRTGSEIIVLSEPEVLRLISKLSLTMNRVDCPNGIPLEVEPKEVER